MRISIVIPIYNESKNIRMIYERIKASMDDSKYTYEVILVNDGSTDSSEAELNHIAGLDKRFKVIHLRRNFGQTAAMMAGFDFASGEVIVPMDGDLQNDPLDIPRLIEKIEEGYDVCSGWRMHRRDNRLKRNFPSWVANRLISMVSGVKLHDYGCSLKAYRSEIIKDVKLYGEMHRFIPIYARWQGAKIAEIPVNHNPRVHGKSKYGLERTFKVFLDLIFLMSFMTLSNKPIYIFGGVGIINMALAFLSFSLMVYFKFWGGKSFIETPLPQLVVLFVIMGFISILMGFIAELLVRTYYESQGKPVYAIKESRNLEPEI